MKNAIETDKFEEYLDELSAYVESNYDNAIEKVTSCIKHIADDRNWSNIKEMAQIADDLTYYHKVEDWENASFTIKYVLDKDFEKEVKAVSGK